MPSGWWSRNRSCSRSRTACERISPPSPSRWRSGGTPSGAEIKKGDVAIVIGCGPVGLAVICMLKAKGVRTVVASDLSQGRRQLASACGADVAVDPSEDSPYEAPGERGYLKTVPALAQLGVGTMEKLTRLPVPWHHVMRAADTLGAKPKRPVIFECVGVPGIIDGIIASAPLFSRVVVVGVCMEPDKIRPAMAVNKEIDLRFVVGYTPLESATPCTCSPRAR